MALNLYYYAYACFGDFSTFEVFDDQVIDPLKWITFVVFMALAIAYFVVGYILLSRLRRHFVKLYEEFGCALWTALILLTVPLTLRGILDLFHIEDRMDDWGKSLALYNVLFTTVTTFLPILFQISSLVFGFIRHK